MKKLLEKYGKKKVYIALGSLAAVIVVAGVVIGMSLNGNDNKLELKKDTFVVEYGDEVSTEAKAYIKTDDKEVAKNAKVVIDLEKEKGGNNYVAVGKYKGQVSYEEEKVEFTLKVEDTTKPTFKDLKKEIKVEQNAKDVDFTKYFQAEDLSKVTLKVDSSKVDLSKTGEYTLTVTATDEHKNKTKEEVKVIVVSLEEAEKGNVSEMVDGTKPQSEALTQKQEEEKKEETNNAGNNNTTGNTGNTGNGSTGNNTGSNNTGGSNGNAGGSSNSGNSNNGGSQTPYIVYDGRLETFDGNEVVSINKNNPIFNTEIEAFEWAYQQSYWTEFIYGFRGALIEYSDGTYKFSIIWYIPN